jgi:hypothetical protein
MGRCVGLNYSYYSPGENELLWDYLKTVSVMTISEDKGLHHEAENLKVENADIDMLKECYKSCGRKQRQSKQEYRYCNCAAQQAQPIII